MNAVLTRNNNTIRDIAVNAENLPYNAKAISAMKEARAMARGEIPANYRKTQDINEALKELLED